MPRCAGGLRNSSRYARKLVTHASRGAVAGITVMVAFLHHYYHLLLNPPRLRYNNSLLGSSRLGVCARLARGGPAQDGLRCGKAAVDQDALADRQSERRTRCLAAQWLRVRFQCFRSGA
jgi:hypothetical protein